jgi:hypothetical protein
MTFLLDGIKENFNECLTVLAVHLPKYNLAIYDSTSPDKYEFSDENKAIILTRLLLAKKASANLYEIMMNSLLQLRGSLYDHISYDAENFGTKSTILKGSYEEEFKNLIDTIGHKMENNLSEEELSKILKPSVYYVSEKEYAKQGEVGRLTLYTPYYYFLGDFLRCINNLETYYYFLTEIASLKSNLSDKFPNVFVCKHEGLTYGTAEKEMEYIMELIHLSVNLNSILGETNENDKNFNTNFTFEKFNSFEMVIHILIEFIRRFHKTSAECMDARIEAFSPVVKKLWENKKQFTLL